MARKTNPVKAVTGTVGKVAGGVGDVAGTVAETIGDAASGAVKAVAKALPIGGQKAKRPTGRSRTPKAATTRKPATKKASAPSGAKPTAGKKASATSGAKPAARKSTTTPRKRSSSS
jgi:hypothetical protein